MQLRTPWPRAISSPGSPTSPSPTRSPTSPPPQLSPNNDDRLPQLRVRRRPDATMASAKRTALLLPLLAAGRSAAQTLDCKHVQTDGFRFDLSALGGPHSVYTSVYHPPRFTNVTYTLDICEPLKRSDDVKKGDECPNGSWVCGITHFQDTEKNTDTLGDVRPIAGTINGPGTLEPVATRLSTSESDKDKGKVGVRLLLQGGKYESKKQKAVIEFLCNPDVEGTEGEWTPADFGAGGKSAAAGPLAAREGGASDDPVPKQLKKENTALIWDSYGPSEEDPKNVEVLKLTWHTKYACEESGGNGDGESSHWGFFTWMVIIVFLGAAAYLIFGSWLNYNRYGARGWDLLPHGDTIRDVPYLLQDWTRSLINTLQGSGSRGGYSAV